MLRLGSPISCALVIGALVAILANPPAAAENAPNFCRTTITEVATKKPRTRCWKFSTRLNFYDQYLYDPYPYIFENYEGYSFRYFYILILRGITARQAERRVFFPKQRFFKLPNGMLDPQPYDLTEDDFRYVPYSLQDFGPDKIPEVYYRVTADDVVMLRRTRNARSVIKMCATIRRKKKRNALEPATGPFCT